MAFSIIISEKGGAERREAFDKNEINVGRVQGNDLMLPKGNVSKHHARLLYRDGRFIVTDLKSTNGTYVNGRKIAQATIVREGDKIYIGDFVLRLEAPSGAVAPPPEPQPTGDEESIRTLARNNAPGQPLAPPPPQPAVTLKAPTHPPGAIQPRPMPPPAQIVAPPPRNDVAQPNRFELERDPDESEPIAGQQKRPSVPPPAPPQPVIQAPPPGQQPNMRASTMPLQQVPAAMMQPRPPATQSSSNVPAIPQQQAAPPQPVAPPPQPQRGPTAPPPPVQAPPPPAQVQHPGNQQQPTRVAPRETAAQAGRRLALITLVDRIADAVDLSALRNSPVVDENFSQTLDRAAREQANAMRDEGEAPEGIDLDLLVRDALRELVGLGPVGPLLEDDDVTEIHCVRHDQVLAVRSGNVTVADTSFTSEEALYRVISRLAQQAGEPWKPGETSLERRLPRGAQMLAVTPPASSGHVLLIRKRRRVDMGLEDMVRSGVLSRPMAVFIESCLVARVNILVCGASNAGTTQLVAALSGTGPSGERISVIHDVEEINVAHAHVVSFAIPEGRARCEDTVRAAARLRPDRFVVTQTTSAITSAVVESISEGTDGVILATTAPTLRQAVARLGSQLALARPGIGTEAIRDAIGESFDIGIEIGLLPDGRQRIIRIAELAGADTKTGAVRDLFTYIGEAGAPEQNFTATGVVPRIAQDLGARGIKIDGNLFKRAAGRA